MKFPKAVMTNQELMKWGFLEGSSNAHTTRRDRTSRGARAGQTGRRSFSIQRDSENGLRNRRG